MRFALKYFGIHSVCCIAEKSKIIFLQIESLIVFSLNIVSKSVWQKISSNLQEYNMIYDDTSQNRAQGM